MSHTDATPIPSPENLVDVENNLSIPDLIEFETTGELSRGAYNVANGDNQDEFVTPENFLDQLASRVADHKPSKAHGAILMLVTALFGSGGAMAVIYATRDAAKANTVEVENLKTLEPRIGQVEKTIDIIKVQVGAIDKSMNAIETSQAAIAGGIEELKHENVNRLKNELDDVKRELRLRERNNRR